MIVVVADDLTGASEIAGVCLRYGLTVSFGIDKLPQNALADVVIVSTDSRSIGETAAFEIQSATAQKIKEHYPSAILFKKCDSVLRGHVLTELWALQQCFRNNITLLEPANPATLRCIKNGTYYFENKDLHQSGFKTDPDFPALVSEVEDLLVSRTSFKDKYPNIFSGKISLLQKDGLYIPDCDKLDDLQNLAKFANSEILLAGSAAFFEQILLKFFPDVVLNEYENTLEKSYFLVLGSIHPNSVAFRAGLENNGCKMITLPAEFLAESINVNELKSWAEQESKKVCDIEKIALAISNQKIQFENSSVLLKNRLSVVVSVFLQHIKPRNVYIEGGASAYDIMKFIGIDEFNAVAELIPGVVSLESKAPLKLKFTLKPGSYSWPKNLFFN